jgi:hypothetical protein
MTIRYKCAECGAALNIKDELAGTKGNCPRCQVEFTVPAAEGAPAEKEPAAASQNPAEPLRSAGGPLSEDEIERILEGSGPSTALPDSRVAVADNGDEHEDENQEFDEPPRRKKNSRAVADEDEEADEDDGDDAGDDEDDDEEEARRRKKKKQKVVAKAGAKKKSDSSESAAIARDLMARGEKGQAAEKRAGRPFGGRDREEEGEFTTQEKLVYLGKQFWPYLAAAVFLIGCTWWALRDNLKLPPLAYVTGTVTLDGAPLGEARVSFQPQGDGTPQSTKGKGTSDGFTNDKGQYVLVYQVGIQGAVIGKHIVRITKMHETKGELVPPRYNQKSELTADVKKGAGPFDFDIISAAESKEPVAGAMQPR